MLRIPIGGAGIVSAPELFMRPACAATFILLEAPILLAELARYLATRKDFILAPCDANALRTLELVTAAYGYEVQFHAPEELVYLRHRESLQHCICPTIAMHLSAGKQIRLIVRDEDPRWTLQSLG